MSKRLAQSVAGLALLAASTASLSPLFAATQVADGSSDTEEPVTLLVSAFSREIRTLPAVANSEDLEASLMYVISQADMPLPTVFAALDGLEANAGDRTALRQAIDNVRAALRRKLRRGTASIGGFGFSSAFSAPIGGGGGGGGSNYSR